MRTIGHIEGTPYKITVNHHNNRYILKFETALYEQNFKLRESEAISSFEDVKVLAHKLLPTVHERFQNMHKSMNSAINQIIEQKFPEPEFEEII